MSLRGPKGRSNPLEIAAHPSGIRNDTRVIISLRSQVLNTYNPDYSPAKPTHPALLLKDWLENVFVVICGNVMITS